MPIIYKSIQSKMQTQEGQLMYHPRVQYTGNVNTKRIAEEVAAYSSLTPGDVKNTIDNLVTVITTHLQSSETVTLDGLGTFRIALRSRGEGFATDEEVNATKAAVVVRFTPSATLNADRTVSTRSLVSGVKFVRLDKTTGSSSSDTESDNSSSSGGGDDDESLYG